MGGFPCPGTYPVPADAAYNITADLPENHAAHGRTVYFTYQGLLDSFCNLYPGTVLSGDRADDQHTAYH